MCWFVSLKSSRIIVILQVKQKLINMDFIEELTWRGMVHSVMPGTTEILKSGVVTAYLGIDPTADSLHIGHLVGVMMLRHHQRCGHKPIALIGGATGMIGDPSMKSQERKLIDEMTLRHNQEAIKRQLSKFLDFDSDAPNSAELVNNYDWMKDYGFLDFIRDIGKHITVNYMMAKDSVKKRLNGEDREGMSFTEFSYQLLQGYDYLHLSREKGCMLQLGGSDQWGNITTGADLIRKIDQREVFGLVCPLITKADGGKFGKTESGNVWLDSRYTSPYKFYQFWLNTSDDDAEKYIRIFTSLCKEEIEGLSALQKENPGARPLQKRLAKELTVMVHSVEEYNMAVEASQILFRPDAAELLHSIDEKTLLEVMDGVPQFTADKANVTTGKFRVVDLLTAPISNVFPSKSELRKMAIAGGLSINKQKISDPNIVITSEMLLQGKYLLCQRGKKNYFLFVFV